ncbi:NACHT domain-containing protein [Streptomyces spirodelae]|uniref:NACHT domain-containing protein n=1 Tax=Streptomyces spirodelae TaxID=2812904 RepID=A0ABS3X2N0_9ACTN|nr:hypothetical protein [Streptomyces spirodelae]MBO8189632.1 hypothetical protein [Streptomyces spirodelae]
MGGGTANLSAGRQVLRDKLRELEAKALQGRSRTEAIARANDLLRQAGFPPLSPTRVGGWFEKGSPAKDFEVLWALIRVLLEWSGQPPTDALSGPDRARAAIRWTNARELWRTRWEQAKALRPAPTTLSPADALPVDAYLGAVRNFATQHPYPMSPGSPYGAGDTPVPALADVYVRRQTRPLPPDALDGQEAPPRIRTTGAGPAVPAGEIFRADSTLCVLLAGPGGGKTTLFRAHLADSAERWLNRSAGKADATIPVLVNARDLTGSYPLPVALAKTATSQLKRFGLLDELSAEFFRHRPLPGVSWLVLVDGLDEIPDTGIRGTVLRMLAAAAAAGHSPYRFVVATRLLPAKELEPPAPQTSRFELQPFSRSDQLAYAARYFRSLDDPGRHARTFMAGLQRSRLDDMARTPLMASMLCRLHAAAPTRPLPDGRTSAYRSFVELIYEQNAHKNIRDTHDEAIRRLKDRHQIPRHNQAAEKAAQRVRDHLPELIDHLAHERIGGNSAPAVQVLASHLHVNRPDKVNQQLWNSFLGDLLRPTGLLVQHMDDFDFLHQTLLEYHAARHATRDAKARAHVLQAVFPESPPGHNWKPPELDPSYLGFLLDGLLGPQDRIADATARRLEDVAARGGEGACTFLTTQVRLRTALPPDPTAAQLIRFAEDPSLSAVLEAQYGNVRFSSPRMDAAWALAQLDGYREDGAARLTRLADDTALEDTTRVKAAWALAQVDGYREDGATRLTRLADDTAWEVFHRIEAAKALAGIDGCQDDAVMRLSDFADDCALGISSRSRAARILTWVEGHSHEGAARLVAFADDLTLEDSDRLEAAWALVETDGYQDIGNTQLLRLADSLDPLTRIRAASALAEADEYRDEAAARLSRLADNRALYGFLRVDAAEALARVDGYRDSGIARLLAFAEDPEVDLDQLERVELAMLLEELEVE